MKLYILALVILAGVAAGARSAAADDATVAWSTPADGCVPVSNTEGNWLSLAGGGVTHASGVTGQLQWVCPVTTLNATSAPNRIYMTYVDSSGSGNGGTVSATLIESSRSNAATSNIVSLSSDSFSNTTITEQKANFTHTFDFSNYFYYVVITLNRTTTGTTTDCYHVDLEYNVT